MGVATGTLSKADTSISNSSVLNHALGRFVTQPGRLNASHRIGINQTISFHTIVLYYPSQPTHMGRGDKLGCSITFNVCASFSCAHAQ